MMIRVIAKSAAKKWYKKEDVFYCISFSSHKLCFRSQVFLQTHLSKLFMHKLKTLQKSGVSINFNI